MAIASEAESAIIFLQVINEAPMFDELLVRANAVLSSSTAYGPIQPT
ncbi:MAG TPA: hypothetical protein VJ023_21885 [Pyrinomonadaceae bacterium]|nr:hypothetical protein [Pyrinomonadaceae bacterium]